MDSPHLYISYHDGEFHLYLRFLRAVRHFVAFVLILSIFANIYLSMRAGNHYNSVYSSEVHVLKIYCCEVPIDTPSFLQEVPSINLRRSKRINNPVVDHEDSTTNAPSFSGHKRRKGEIHAITQI